MEIENRTSFSKSKSKARLKTDSKKLHPNISTLGKNIKPIMERMGLTIKKVAEHAEVSYETVRGLTSGTGNPTLDSTYRILECLNVNPDLTDLALSDKNDRELSDVIYYFQNLQDDEKKIALGILQVLSFLKYTHNRDRAFYNAIHVISGIKK